MNKIVFPPCVAHSPMSYKKAITTQWESEVLLEWVWVPGALKRDTYPDWGSEGSLPGREGT